MNNVVKCLASNLNSRTEFNRFQLNPTALIRADQNGSGREPECVVIRHRPVLFVVNNLPVQLSLAVLNVMSKPAAW